MVYAKWSQEAWSDNRQLFAPPCVGQPMNQPAHEIGAGPCEKNGKNHRPLDRPNASLNCCPNGFPSDCFEASVFEQSLDSASGTMNVR